MIFKRRVKKYTCELCPHECEIAVGGIGFCRARTVSEDAKGEIMIASVNYGKMTSVALDPIEKKPLSHYYPGMKILSVGSFGCNLRCPWCQNYTIAMAKESDVDTRYIPPEELAALAKSAMAQGNIGVAFTYNEPLIGWEYLYDAAQIVKEQGMKTVLVTNGYINPSYFAKLLPHIDALNIDLKSISHDFYFKIGGDLDTVLDNIRLAAASAHVELTTLLIDEENDSEVEMEGLVDFVASVSPDIPLHISRFFPHYRYTDRQPTSLDAMHQFEEIARRKLKYVHLGNV